MTLSLSLSELAKEIGRRLAQQGKSLGLTQAAAAEQSRLSLFMLRRAENHGSIPLQQLLKLANTIGCQLHLDRVPLKLGPGAPASCLNQQHPGLVCSNSKASKEIYLRKALLNPPLWPAAQASKGLRSRIAQG